MHRTSINLFSILSLLFGIQCAVFAQSGENSPFSRFGIGDINNHNTTHLNSMGGISASFADPYHVNLVNPASYSSLRSAAFDFGVQAKNANLQEGDQSFRSWSGNIEYISLSFPLRNPLNEVLDRSKKQYWLGMSFALLPYSNVNYNISTLIDDENIGNFEQNFSGTGGSYKVQWGNSFKYKGLSVGLHLGYLFGKIENSSNTFFNDSFTAFDNVFSRDYSFKGFTWNAGAIYQLYLNTDKVKNVKGTRARYLNIGLHGNSQSSISTNSTIFDRNVGAFSNIQIDNDTLRFESDIKGTGTLPSELGVGATYFVDRKLAIGVNYILTNWSSYVNDARPEELQDVTKVSFGGYYRPNHQSFDYRDRIYYRFGAFYNEDARSVYQDELKDYGVTLGLGLPFIYQRKISHINLGVTGGKRGNDILSETYVKFRIGLTFNDDQWFIKRKYN